jgi:hypothetical protein
MRHKVAIYDTSPESMKSEEFVAAAQATALDIQVGGSGDGAVSLGKVTAD